MYVYQDMYFWNYTRIFFQINWHVQCPHGLVFNYNGIKIIWNWNSYLPLRESINLVIPLSLVTQADQLRGLVDYLVDCVLICFLLFALVDSLLGCFLFPFNGSLLCCRLLFSFVGSLLCCLLLFALFGSLLCCLLLFALFCSLLCCLLLFALFGSLFCCLLLDPLLFGSFLCCLLLFSLDEPFLWVPPSGTWDTDQTEEKENSVII